MSQNPDLPSTNSNESKNPIHQRQRWKESEENSTVNPPTGPPGNTATNLYGSRTGIEEKNPQNSGTRGIITSPKDAHHSYVPKITTTSQQEKLTSNKKFENKQHGYMPISPNKMMSVPYNRETSISKRQDSQKSSSPSPSATLGFAEAHPAKKKHDVGMGLSGSAANIMTYDEDKDEDFKTRLANVKNQLLKVKSNEEVDQKLCNGNIIKNANANSLSNILQQQEHQPSTSNTNVLDKNSTSHINIVEKIKNENVLLEPEENKSINNVKNEADINVNNTILKVEKPNSRKNTQTKIGGGLETPDISVSSTLTKDQENQNIIQQLSQNELNEELDLLNKLEELNSSNEKINSKLSSRATSIRSIISSKSGIPEELGKGI